MLKLKQELKSAYIHCHNIARSHYENFPVASWLLGRELRYPVSAVYAFARSADDFADEGNLSHEQRLEQLDNFAIELQKIELYLSTASHNVHNSGNPIFIALADVIKNHQIPLQLFHDLLRAFKNDVTTKRYRNYNDVLSYCCLSANPVGRILLYLHDCATDANLGFSDAICTGLQLINFYQDIAQDMDENDRLYIPLDELQRFGVSIDDIKTKKNNDRTKALMTFQIQRARQLYYSGKPLCKNLSGRFGLEIRTIFAGGDRILDKLQQNVSSIYLRPRLSKKDKCMIILQGFFPAH